MKTDRRILLSGVAILFAAGWADVSAAQTVRGALSTEQAGTEQASNFARDRSISVRQRRHEGYEALGVPVGVFMAWPKISATVENNDNIYAASSNEADDTIWRVEPELRLTSTWSRHYLEAYARGTVNRYSDFESENSEAWAVGATGRIDVHSTFNITGSANQSHNIEPRTSANTPITAIEPIQYDVSQGFVAATKEFNRLRIAARVDLNKFDYEDGEAPGGAAIEQDDRDRTVQILTGRADYAVSPDTALFVEVSGNKRNYRLSPPAVFASRDSDGYMVLAGANFELSALARGEIGVGYISQSYDDAAFEDIDGFGARAQVEWFPTELTTVTLTGSRTIEDSGIPGDSGYLATVAGAQIDHELLRNVILTAQVGYGKDQHEGAIQREDKRVNAGVSGTYLLNRNVGVTVGYAYLDQNSNLAGFDFKQNKIAASLTFQF